MSSLHHSRRGLFQSFSRAGVRIRLAALGLLCATAVAFSPGSFYGTGSFAGGFTLTPVEGTSLSVVEMQAVGKVKHFGKSTLTLRSTVDFSGGSPQPVPTTTGEVTAANGDRVMFVLQWTASTVESGVFEITGPFRVTGGTGKFSGTQGVGTYEGLVDTNTGKVTATIEGEILR